MGVIEEAWRRLACAVVQQTIIDWQASVEWLEEKDTESIDSGIVADVEELKRNCEKFFQSGTCELFSGINGNLILRRLQNGERFNLEEPEDHWNG